MFSYEMKEKIKQFAKEQARGSGDDVYGKATSENGGNEK